MTRQGLFEKHHQTRRLWLWLAAVVLAASVPASPAVNRPASPQNGVSQTSRGVHPKLPGEPGSFKLPVRFEENVGQTAPEVKYVVRGAGAAMSLTAREAVTVLESRENKRTGSLFTIKQGLLGASPARVVTGLGRLRAKAAYFVGADPSRWRTNVPAFARVRYEEVYPGIDLEYHGSRGFLEYDFVVAPRADPRQIKLSFKGPSRLLLDRNGDLVLKTPLGDVRHRRPVVYQRTEQGHRRVSGRYVVGGKGTVTFSLGSYNPRKPLIIDPEIVYSSFLGGQGYERGWDVAAPDDSGQVYVAGFTTSTDFPGEQDGKRRDTFRGANVGGDGGQRGDGFIAKFDTTKSGRDSLVYTAYLGSSDTDIVTGVAADREGNTYLIGDTRVQDLDKSDFPALSKLPGLMGQDDCGVKPEGLNQQTYGFVAKLNADASHLIYVKCLKGHFAEGFNGVNGGGGVSVDNAGHVYVAGRTSDENFGTKKAAQPGYGGDSDAFLVKLLGDGSSVSYATFLGGASADKALEMVSDDQGNAYVTGVTSSADFPTRNAFQGDLNGFNDVFISKVDTNAEGPSSLLLSTYLGGSGPESGWGLAVDSQQNVYVTGDTESIDFPVHNALQASVSPEDPFGKEAFFAKLQTTLPGSHPPVYSSYLGGNLSDHARGIAVDTTQALYLAGNTGSVNFPVKRPFHPVPADPPFGTSAYLTKISPGGDALVYSSYLGNVGNDRAEAIAVDPSANVFVVGQTSSRLFPQKNAYQVQYGGGSNDMFITKVSPVLPRVSAVVPQSGPTAGGTSVLIQGSGFPGPAEVVGSAAEGGSPLTVKFGEMPAAEVIPISLTHIRAISPPHPAGTVDITVSTFEGTSAKVPEDRFTYIDPEMPNAPPEDLPEELSPAPQTGHGLGAGIADSSSSAVTAPPGPANQLPAAYGPSQGPPPTGPLTAPAPVTAVGPEAPLVQTSSLAPGPAAQMAGVEEASGAAGPAAAGERQSEPLPAPRYHMTRTTPAAALLLLGIPALLALICLMATRENYGRPPEPSVAFGAPGVSY